MAAAYLDHARSKLRFLVEDHGFEEASSWATTQEYLKFHRDGGDDRPGMTIWIGFGFEWIPTLDFQLWKGRKAARSFPVLECRTEATMPLIAEFERRRDRKTLDQACQMWRQGEFDDIFNAVVDEFARIIRDNIGAIKKGEVQDVVRRMQPKKRKRR